MFAAQLGETGGRRRRGAISSRQEQSSPLNGQETFTDAAQRQKRLNGEQYPPTHLSQNSSLEDFTAFTDFFVKFLQGPLTESAKSKSSGTLYFQTFSIKILICSFSNVKILSHFFTDLKQQKSFWLMEIYDKHFFIILCELMSYVGLNCYSGDIQT